LSPWVFLFLKQDFHLFLSVGSRSELWFVESTTLIIFRTSWPSSHTPYSWTITTLWGALRFLSQKPFVDCQGPESPPVMVLRISETPEQAGFFFFIDPAFGCVPVVPLLHVVRGTTAAPCAGPIRRDHRTAGAPHEDCGLLPKPPLVGWISPLLPLSSRFFLSLSPSPYLPYLLL